MTTALRSLLASLPALLLFPLLFPALSQSLPPSPFLRPFEHLAVTLLSLVAALAGVQVVVTPRSRLPRAKSSHLPSPLVRVWTSPLAHARHATTYDQPGRWMTDAELEHLVQTLETVARSSIGAIPSHRLFHRADLRAAFANRVVCVARDAHGPLGFTAMAYLQIPGDVVVHLGLTMMARRARGQRLQSTLFTKTLSMAAVNLARVGFYVTNVAASPAGIGNVCDYFFACYPSYAGSARREHHVRIAGYVLGRYRYEFGCSERARFDEELFVVYASNEREGGGTHEFIKRDGAPVSRHRLEACNKFVDGLIDYSAGDEVFQVATFNVLGSLAKYVTGAKHRRGGSGRTPVALILVLFACYVFDKSREF